MSHRYFDGAGNEVSAVEYYRGLERMARELANALPRWSAGRRRWRALARDYRRYVHAHNSVI